MYNWKFLEQLLLPYNFYDRAMRGMYFLNFGSCAVKLVYKDMYDVLWLNLISHLIMQCIKQDNYHVNMHKKLYHYYDYFCDRMYFFELSSLKLLRLSSFHKEKWLLSTITISSFRYYNLVQNCWDIWWFWPRSPLPKINVANDSALRMNKAHVYTNIAWWGEGGGECTFKTWTMNQTSYFIHIEHNYGRNSD